jgi:hypothetical protein
VLREAGRYPVPDRGPRTIAHELVIGIGGAHIKSSRFSDPGRVVGITTVFSADGNYILSKTSREPTTTATRKNFCVRCGCASTR